VEGAGYSDATSAVALPPAATQVALALAAAVRSSGTPAVLDTACGSEWEPVGAASSTTAPVTACPSRTLARRSAAISTNSVRRASGARCQLPTPGRACVWAVASPAERAGWAALPAALAGHAMPCDPLEQSVCSTGRALVEFHSGTFKAVEPQHPPGWSDAATAPHADRRAMADMSGRVPADSYITPAHCLARHVTGWGSWPHRICYRKWRTRRGHNGDEDRRGCEASVGTGDRRAVSNRFERGEGSSPRRGNTRGTSR
jgi:hypothetical protein